jgi:hypothetical protein
MLEEPYLPLFMSWYSHAHSRFVRLFFGTLTGLPCVVGRLSSVAC